MSQFSENKRPGRLPADDARSAAPDLTVDEKPFRLAKSFSLAAIILIFASVLTLAAVVSRQAEIIITKRVEDDTIKLMTNLNLQMYINFLEPANRYYGRVSLGDQQQRNWLDFVIQLTTLGFDLKRVIIYDENGRAVFATDDTRLPSPAEDPEAVAEAVVLYTNSPRLRIIGPSSPRPVAVEPPPDGQTDTDGTAGENVPDGSAATKSEALAASSQSSIVGRNYETPSPYVYFSVSPFESAPAEDGGAQMETEPNDGSEYAAEAEAGEILSEAPAGPEMAESDERAAEAGTDEILPDDPAGPEMAESDERAAEAGADESGNRVISVGSTRLLLIDVDKKSPAAAPTVVGDEDSFLDYQRSQTVLRHEGGQYLLFNFLPRGEFVLRAYKVMESYQATQGLGLSGILEVTRDLTPEYKQIARLQYFALGVAVFLSLVLTIALRWVVSRGEAILNNRNLERQALRERLDQAERLAGLGSMVATVAHEIRNPLGIIHSTADVLNRFLSGDPDQARLARAIVEEADRLSTVVTEFLDFARPPQPKPAPIVIEEILEEILAFLEIALVRAGVEIRCDFRTDQSPVMGDGPMLHRAFLNILMNAVQAMDDGGLITVATRPERKDGRDWLTVSVSDTGPGLSEETAKKMFSPFYTTKAKGTGLGLVIVRNIVEGHGGQIEMLSRPPSKKGDDTGLTVLIRLPTTVGVSPDG